MHPSTADRIFAFDIKKDPTHDIFGDLWNVLAHSMHDGRIACLLAGQSCKSWSMLLHRRKDGFPPPKRARDDPWKALNPSDQNNLGKESNLIIRVLVLFLIGESMGNSVQFGIEHPEDPEKD